MAKKMKAPKEPGHTPEIFLAFMGMLGITLKKCVKCGGEIWVKVGTKKPKHTSCEEYAAAVQKYGRLEKEVRPAPKDKTYWMSFARSHENYVVIGDAPNPEAAVEKAAPLKDFCPHHWKLEVYELAPDAQELKDFKKGVLITNDELRAKGYLKPSEERLQKLMSN
jgi:hypothetical protein